MCYCKCWKRKDDHEKKIAWMIITGVVGLFLLVMGIAIPYIFDAMLRYQISDGVIFHEADSMNGYTMWGEQPGKTEFVNLHDYHLYDVQNPDDVIYKGAIPLTTDKGGYMYQEFDQYQDRTWKSHDGTDNAWVELKAYLYMDRTEHCIWHNDTSENDQITTINLGPFGAWDQAKHLPAEKIAISALFQLIEGFNVDMVTGVFAQAIYALLSIETPEEIYAVFFQPLGFTLAQSQLIVNDPIYGWNNTQTLTPWIQAYEQNAKNYTFVYPTPPNQAVYLLQNYFGITTVQMTGLMKEIQLQYNAIQEIYTGFFSCKERQPSGNKYCDNTYLGSIQWAHQNVTENIPGGLAPASPSIKFSSPGNNTVLGYPEISYFMNVTYEHKKYQEVVWSTEDYLRLFDYNQVTGFPTGSPTTLLDVGKMNQFYALGRDKNFTGIAAIWNLTNTDYAEVLWDWMNSIVAITALQGRTDVAIYDQDNRGIASELGLGTVAGQTIYGNQAKLAQLLSLELTGRYSYTRLTYDLMVTCKSLVTSTIGANYTQICDNKYLRWSSSNSNINSWITPLWNGKDSTEWNYFQYVANITETVATQLFESTGQWATYLTKFEKEIHTHYDCQNMGDRCYDMELATMQWRNSTVTMNLPAEMTKINLMNTSTVMDWGEPFISSFVAAPEYSQFLMKMNNGMGTIPTMNDTSCFLNFEHLYSGVAVQDFYGHLFEGDVTGAMKIMCNFAEWETLATYIRYQTEKNGFGGIFKTSTVEELLWTGYDTFLAQVKVMNPLAGGDPSTDPTAGRLGQNLTQAMIDAIPSDKRHAMNTGERDQHELRYWKRWFGENYINMWKPVYKGQGLDGPIIDYENVNPWKEKVKVKGTDAWGFQPFVDSDSSITLFLDPIFRTLELKYDKKEIYNNMVTRRFVVDKSFLRNATENPDFDKFYDYGPTGVINQTSVMGAPFFVSQPYFLNADPVIADLVNYTEPQFNEPEQYKTYVDIEEWTGTVFFVNEKLTFNAELKPDALMPKLVSHGYNYTGYRTYLPTMYFHKQGRFRDHIIDKYFGNITVALTMSNAIFVALVFIGVLLLAICIGILVKYCLDKHCMREEDEDEVQFISPEERKSTNDSESGKRRIGIGNVY